jgi:hypothetical protein
MAGLLLALAALPAAGQIAYSVQSDSTTDVLYSIDLGSGVATAVGPTGFQDIESLAFTPGCETLYGIDDVTDRLVTCNTATGACTAVGPLGVDVTDTGLAVTDDGKLYMSTDAPKNPSYFYRVDPATGAATRVGVQGQEVTGLTSSPTLFGLGGDGKNNLVKVDPLSGIATPVGPLGAVNTQDGGLEFALDGALFLLTDGGPAPSNPSRLFTVDPFTGAATFKANVTSGGRPINGFEGLAIDDGICAVFVRAKAIDAPVLGPWGLALLSLGLAAAGLFALRRLG